VQTYSVDRSVLGHRQAHHRETAGERLGGRGDRTDCRGPLPRTPDHEGVFTSQSVVVAARLRALQFPGTLLVQPIRAYRQR